jgi:2-C-methyl-D-erythritol 4-phosphate cytidylyltransferase/2-C-methyl-D-erythritol 2,4-cyclodiphosphate synthase
LRDAHKKAREEGWSVTDDAMLMEQCGLPVRIVEGEEENRKVTTPADLALLTPQGETARMTEYLPCNGFGYDVHQYGGNRPFILGGVPLATDITLRAHSDGDVLLHALMDAILGCMGGPDIGALFPDTDSRFESIESGILLAEVMRLAAMEQLTVTHVDLTLVAQVLRILPFREQIRANVAKMLGLSPSSVAVKATTEEHLGFTGDKRGIKAYALVSAFRKS